MSREKQDAKKKNRQAEDLRNDGNYPGVRASGGLATAEVGGAPGKG